MIDSAMQITVIISSLIVALLSKGAINRMSPGTAFFPRVAFVVLTTGAVASLYSVYSGDVPSASTLLTTVGLALLLICDRWRNDAGGMWPHSRSAIDSSPALDRRSEA